MLSISGKETLLKAVAQAIPVYAMSVFNIPKNICKAICDAIARYWWGDTQEKRRSTGRRGGRCAFLRKREVWAFVIYIVLTKLC